MYYKPKNIANNKRFVLF